MSYWFEKVKEQVFASEPRPGLHPIPGSAPLTVVAAICPPLLYYVALLLLPPDPPPAVNSLAVKTLRNVLALIAGLVGIYGGCRVLDAFFISPYIYGHIPRRVKYEHLPRPETPVFEREDPYGGWTDGGVKDPFTVKDESSGHATSSSADGNLPHILSRKSAQSDLRRASQTSANDPSYRRPSVIRSAASTISSTLSGPSPTPVYKHAHTEQSYPTTLSDRAKWALELELSMRGVGFTWTTADVRHTRKTWMPTIQNRLHSITLHVVPILVVCWLVIKSIYVSYFAPYADLPWDDSRYSLFDTLLPLPQQLLLTAALGAFLMAAFSFGHSLFAIMLHPLSPHPLSFFPPLYSTRAWDLTSVRKFWSFGWHRLFARLFLVYGVWPGEFVERKLTGKSPDQAADIGKVIGGFLSSAFVHAFSVRGVLRGEWGLAAGEAKFFAMNGAAVIVEEVAKRVVKMFRKGQGWDERPWYDAWIGRVWWISVLLWTGRNFARGWVMAGLVREMAFM